MNIHILNYNNYYNRIVKHETQLYDYLQYRIYVLSDTNFNPSDGINTTHIVGSNQNMYNGAGDYIIVESDGQIISRWFLLEANRTREGQWRLDLYRDVMVDYLDQIMDSPCFIEKATLAWSDNMIFNSEDMTFNKIKTSYNANNPELLLKDRTKCAWLTGYFARTTGEATTTLQGTVAGGSINANFSIDNIENWEYYQYVSSDYVVADYITGYTITALQNTFAIPAETTYIINNINPMTVTSQFATEAVDINTIFNNNNVTAFDLQEEFKNAQEEMRALANKIINNSGELNVLEELNDKIIIDESTGVYYRITINYTGQQASDNIPISSSPGIESNTLFGFMARKCINAGMTERTSLDNAFSIIGASISYYRIHLTALGTSNITYNIVSARQHLQDAPYDMFAIPFTNELKINAGTDDVFNTSVDVAKKVVANIIEKYSGSGGLYDVQILPYCPVEDFLPEILENEIDMSELDTSQYSYIVDSDENKVGVIFNGQSSNHRMYIPLGDNSIAITEPKIQSECDNYRFCSPNFNSAFDFNVAKNGGLSAVWVYMTCYPYNPYIQVSPEFNRLYGSVFNDSRGLICQGDFSLTVITDNWIQYQLQNKNYLNSFNRQIENMSIRNNVQREQEIWGAVSGAFGGAVSGAFGGAAIGSRTGSGIGALAGGIISGIAGARDIQLGEKLRREAIDFTKDQFGYSLGNIRAVADSLAKVSSITVNNRLFPFIEYYTCTNEEKEALRNKIKYNGMTVMRIGKIKDFIKEEQTYIKGKLIRIEGIDEDFHILNTIANEIYKGVYI